MILGRRSVTSPIWLGIGSPNVKLSKRLNLNPPGSLVWPTLPGTSPPTQRRYVRTGSELFFRAPGEMVLPKDAGGGKPYHPPTCNLSETGLDEYHGGKNSR